jgi:hypothetical protein
VSAVSPRLARAISRQTIAPPAPVARVDSRTVLAMRAPDLACSIDGSMPAANRGAPSVTARPVERVASPPRLHVTTHAKRHGLTEVRFIHDRSNAEPLRVGKITVPRMLWLAVYRRMLLWACGERLVSLTLDEHASEFQSVSSPFARS